MAYKSSKALAKPEQSPRHVGVWDPLSALRRELTDYSTISVPLRVIDRAAC